jgi:MYXO-CTERM domain-containing protein
MCDLYLGAPDGRAMSPPSPFANNVAVQTGTDTFVAGTTYSIVVELQNADTQGGCSGALVNLYWADPTTSYLVASANQIDAAAGANPVLPIGVATTIPPADAATLFQFSWTPDATVAATHGGQIALVAIASSTTTDCIAPPPSSSGQAADTASPQVAVHDVHVELADAGAVDGGAPVDAAVALEAASIVDGADAVAALDATSSSDGSSAVAVVGQEGGGTQACVPGQAVACVGPGGCGGGQACNAQGTAYGDCVCASTTVSTADAGGGEPVSQQPSGCQSGAGAVGSGGFFVAALLLVFAVARRQRRA